jgi:hypothetical protein
LTKLINLPGRVYWGQEKFFEENKDEKSLDTVLLRYCYATKLAL